MAGYIITNRDGSQIGIGISDVDKNTVRIRLQVEGKKIEFLVSREHAGNIARLISDHLSGPKH